MIYVEHPYLSGHSSLYEDRHTSKDCRFTLIDLPVGKIIEFLLHFICFLRLRIELFRLVIPVQIRFTVFPIAFRRFLNESQLQRFSPSTFTYEFRALIIRHLSTRFTIQQTSEQRSVDDRFRQRIISTRWRDEWGDGVRIIRSNLIAMVRTTIGTGRLCSSPLRYAVLLIGIVFQFENTLSSATGDQHA